MIKISAHQVADYFIRFSHDHGDPISNLKLQKLLYYAQAWYLAIFDSSLFDDPIEAWVHGPVVPQVYRRFKEWAWQPISYHPPDTLDLGRQIDAHLSEVIDVYGGMTAYDLERLTHSEMPWRKARGNLPIDEPSNNKISLDDMKQYYGKRLDGENQEG